MKQPHTSPLTSSFLTAPRPLSCGCPPTLPRSCPSVGAIAGSPPLLPLHMSPPQYPPHHTHDPTFFEPLGAASAGPSCFHDQFSGPMPFGPRGAGSFGFPNPSMFPPTPTGTPLASGVAMPTSINRLSFPHGHGQPAAPSDGITFNSCAEHLPPFSTSLQQRIMKTKLCVHHLHGRCARGAHCTFAHSVKELRKAPNLYKTRLCINFTNTGNCPKGDQCRFAHGQAELRAGDSEDVDENASRPTGLAAEGNENEMSSGARFPGDAQRSLASSMSSCFESPTLLSAKTPSSMRSPATPYLERDRASSSESTASGSSAARLPEADAIEALLKLPQDTRQQLVDLVIRTVSATQSSGSIERLRLGGVAGSSRRPATMFGNSATVANAGLQMRPRNNSSVGVTTSLSEFPSAANASLSTHASTSASIVFDRPVLSSSPPSAPTTSSFPSAPTTPNDAAMAAAGHSIDASLPLFTSGASCDPSSAPTDSAVGRYTAALLCEAGALPPLPPAAMPANEAIYCLADLAAYQRSVQCVGCGAEGAQNTHAMDQLSLAAADAKELSMQEQNFDPPRNGGSDDSTISATESKNDRESNLYSVSDSFSASEMSGHPTASHVNDSSQMGSLCPTLSAHLDLLSLGSAPSIYNRRTTADFSGALSSPENIDTGRDRSVTWGAEMMLPRGTHGAFGGYEEDDSATIEAIIHALGKL